jgi:transposase
MSRHAPFSGFSPEDKGVVVASSSVWRFFERHVISFKKRNDTRLH